MPLSRRTLLSGAAAAAASAADEMLRLPKKVRLGLIGVEGHTSEVTRPMRSLPDLELAAISDPDPKQVESFARNPLAAKARRYTDAHKLLASEALDMVAICGDNGSRAGLIVAAAGRKLHIVAEKPLAIQKSELDKVKRAIADNGVHLTMLLPMRYEPVYKAMRQVVESGQIGEVAQMGAQKSYKLGERSEWMRHHDTFGGTIPYIAVHMVDLMRFTSGRELVEAASFQGRIGHPEMRDMENTTATVFRMDNGGTAALRMDYLRPETAPTHGDDRLRLAGTKGVLEYQAATGLTLVTDKAAPHVIRDLPPEGSLFRDFLRSVYLGQPPTLSLQDIYRVNEIVLGAREGAEARRIVRL
jgi:predicted dehydrogenase